MKKSTLRKLKKLCLEIWEICILIYATLQNDEEKQAYIDIVKNIKSSHEVVEGDVNGLNTENVMGSIPVISSK